MIREDVPRELNMLEANLHIPLQGGGQNENEAAGRPAHQYKRRLLGPVLV